MMFRMLLPPFHEDDFPIKILILPWEYCEEFCPQFKKARATFSVVRSLSLEEAASTSSLYVASMFTSTKSNSVLLHFLLCLYRS